MRLLVILLIACSSQVAFARGGGGGWSLGANLGITASDQTDMNTLITRANSRDSISTGQFGNAWEFSGFISYRTSSMLALQFRPSYYYSAVDGSGSGGSYDYSVTGFTLFPIFRFYLLESNYIKFFTQVGVGWGFLFGSVKEGAASAEFSGNAMGTMAGLGAEFCFTGNHCISVEGNFRLLRVQRVTSDASTNNFVTTGATPSLSQSASGQEVELDGADLSATMSGVQGFIGYVFYF
ncbi:MAG: outer membrane beta-barrel protein [Bdellovibrionales bacterium]|nr:outer membrane beta-barrel protein [Bdellovibrionales bacterium]